MEQTYISDIGRRLGQEVTIKGWLYHKRSSGKLGFLEIRDGSGIIQGVLSKKDVSEACWNESERVTQESAIIVLGVAREHPKRPGVYELDIKDLQIVQLAHEYPITPKEHGV
ncbi:MAG: asparagine--tRNA ligase, partial [Blastocatellia bacterium]|nr:asparagine--tRNA ligase [Blastocatellia bacterium]